MKKKDDDYHHQIKENEKISRKIYFILFQIHFWWWPDCDLAKRWRWKKIDNELYLLVVVVLVVCIRRWSPAPWSRSWSHTHTHIDGDLDFDFFLSLHLKRKNQLDSLWTTSQTSIILFMLYIKCWHEKKKKVYGSKTKQSNNNNQFKNPNINDEKIFFWERKKKIEYLKMAIDFH